MAFGQTETPALPLGAAARKGRVAPALLALGSLLSCARFGYDLLEESPVGAGGADASSGAGAGGTSTAGVPSAGASSVGDASAGAGGQGLSGGTELDASLGPVVVDASDSSAAPVDSGLASVDSGPAVVDSGSPPTDTGPPPVAPAVCVFGAPELLAAPNFPGNEAWSPTLSTDARSMYIGVVVPGILEQIVLSERPDRGLTFGLGNPLLPPVTVAKEGTPFLLPNGRSLYFYSDRPGGEGGRDLYVATRPNTGVDFDTVIPLTELNTAGSELVPWVSADERTIFFASDRDSGSENIWRATRTSTGDSFGAPSLVTELNSGGDDGSVTFSADQRVVIFASRRPGGVGDWDLYRASRATTSEPFSAPQLVPNVNTANMDTDATLTADGQELFFVSGVVGLQVELWRSSRTCL